MGHIAHLRNQFKSMNTFEPVQINEYIWPKDDFGQVWLKLAQWFWIRVFKFVNVFSEFPNYFPLEKGGPLHSNKLVSPSPKDELCQVWLKLAQWFKRRRRKLWKFYDDDNNDDNGQILIRKAHLSLLLRWAKNVVIIAK